MTSLLAQLTARYPLSKSWTNPEVFEDALQIGTLKLRLLGLVTTFRDGKSMTGAAVENSLDPALRAYFELIERTSIQEAEQADKAEWRVFSRDRQELGLRLRNEIFPVSNEPTQWQFSRSNGVAAHMDWSAACDAAAKELIERDRILRAWLGECPIETVSSRPAILSPLFPYYDFEITLFRYSQNESPVVAGVFGFPKGSEVPRIYGFGVGSEAQGAIDCATKECLQGMGFLWGESVSQEPPVFSPTPDFHQAVYLQSEGINKIREWICGSHAKFAKGASPSFAEPFLFVDLTPPHLATRLAVVKALNPSLYPLQFGIGPLIRESGLPKELWLHPMA